MASLVEAGRDDLGPAKIVRLWEPRTGLDAMVVVDNVAAGPAIGGARMAADVSLEEVARLARAMTLKNAAAGLPHGGAKAGIRATPSGGPRQEELMRAFARAIGELVDYIPGPDMGTDEQCMAWVHDEIGRCVGLPAALGGIPLDDLGATGYGLAACADALEEAGLVRLAGSRIVVQGFGAVGRHAARFLQQRGAVLVAASDSKGAVRSEDGLDVDELWRLKAGGRSVIDLDDAKPISPEDLVGVPCDIWIPAARPDVLTEHNVVGMDTKIVLEGANIPATPAAEELLHRAGVVVVPDFVANAGGVICASVEYHGGTRAQAFAQIEETIRANAAEVLERAARDGRPPRAAATDLALGRVREAMSYCR
jgi:glutamate dehydrogenase/leucine dehydrogenase